MSINFKLGTLEPKNFLSKKKLDENPLKMFESSPNYTSFPSFSFKLTVQIR